MGGGGGLAMGGDVGGGGGVGGGVGGGIQWDWLWTVSAGLIP